MPKQHRTQLAVVAAACLLTAGAAQAQDAFRFSGFGTVGASITDTDKAEFVTPGQPGNGATKDVSFAPDTKLGLQGSYRFNSVFSATAQVLTKYTGAGDWDPSLEWAFVKAQPVSGLTIRAGRMGAPTFAISDFREVNYANLWVRPPLEVYAQVPLASIDGADISYQHTFGPAIVTGTLFGGKQKSDYNNTEIELENAVGVNFTAEFDNGLTLRAGYSQGDLSISGGRLPTLVGGLRSTAVLLGALPGYAANATALANQLGATEQATFTGIGATWDLGQWIFNAEYTVRRGDHWVSDSTGWYASAGYRLGKVTPYVYVAQLKVDEQKLSNPVTATAVSLGGAQVAALRAGIAGVIAGQDYGQKTVAIGARWDAFKSVAFKAQLERIKPDGANGLFYVSPTSTSNISGDSVNVFTLSADFVF
ncbi:MAG: porin [Aquabacterium sp.]|nr:porin [Aquabacterium sp.]